MKQENTTEASKLTPNTEENIAQFNWDNENPEGATIFNNDIKPKGKSRVDEIINEEDEKDEEIEETNEDDNEETTEDDENRESDEESEVEDDDNENKEDKNKPKDKTKNKEVKKPVENNKPDPKKTDNKETDADKLAREETYSILAEELKDEGILTHVELPKKKSISHKELLGLVEKDKELAIEAGLKEMFEGLDETGSEYLKFIKNGGKTEDFINTFVEQSVPDLDITDKKVWKDVIITYLVSVGKMDEEDAEDQYNILKENGKDEKLAKTYYKALKEADEERKAELLAKQDRKAKKEVKERQEFSEKLSNELKEDDLDGIPLTNKDKKILPDYITKGVKVLDGKKVTGFQYKLSQVLKEPRQLLKLAKILESDFKFDFIEAKVKTNTSKTIKRSLENRGKDLKSSGTTNKKSLADFFPG